MTRLESFDDRLAIASAGLAALPSGYTGGVWNPEDMMRLPASSWAVVSSMRDKHHPGALRLLDLALFVVDHGGGEAVDRFTLDTRGRPHIVAHARIAMPAATSGNGIAPLPDGGFVVAGAVDPRDTTTLARLAKARPTGQIWRWSPASGWRPLGPRLSGVNGVAISADGRSVYASEWAARKVWRMHLDGVAAVWSCVSFLPDNLHWSGGALLVAGQIGRADQIYRCAMRGSCHPMGYVVATVDPRTVRATPVLAVSERAARRASFGGVSGALRFGGRLWLTTFMGRRIAYRTVAPRRQPTELRRLTTPPPRATPAA